MAALAEANGDLSMKNSRFCSEIGHWQLDGLNYCFHPPCYFWFVPNPAFRYS